MVLSGRPACPGRSAGGVGVVTIKLEKVTAHASAGVDIDRAAEKTAGAGVEVALEGVSEELVAVGAVVPSQEPAAATPAASEPPPVYRIINTWFAPSSVTRSRPHESKRTSTGREPLGHVAVPPAWHRKSFGEEKHGRPSEFMGMCTTL